MPITIENLRSGSKRILGNPLGQAGLIIVSLLLAFWFGTCHQEDKWDREYREYRQSAIEAANVFALQKQAEIDSLIQENMNWKDSTNVHRVKSFKLENEVRDLKTQLTAGPAPLDEELPVVCNTCVAKLDTALKAIAERDTLIAKQDSQIVELKAVIAADSMRIMFLEAAANASRFTIDSLRVVINNAPEPRNPKKLFGFIKIGPTESFLAGVGTTLLTVTAIAVSKN